MESKKLTFKTNINCGGCINAVKPQFENNQEISSWNVDTQSPDKILTVESNGIEADEVIRLVKDKGFTIEEI